MDTLLTIHSILRWFIILVAALAIIKYSIGWASNSTFKGMDRGLAAALSGLMDAQVLLGLVYFLWNGFSGGGFPAYRWLHMGLMFAAAVLIHMPGRMKLSGDKQRFKYTLISILAAILLVFVGIAILK